MSSRIIASYALAPARDWCRRRPARRSACFRQNIGPRNPCQDLIFKTDTDTSVLAAELRGGAILYPANAGLKAGGRPKSPAPQTKCYLNSGLLALAGSADQF